MESDAPRRLVCGAPPSLFTLRVVVMSGCLAATAPGVAWAADSGSALRIVRMGYGNVRAMKEGILRSVEACRAVKRLPPGSARLPGDAQLAQLAVVEQEELFDGQKWALFDTQREIGADGANGCQLALYATRKATVEKTCVSRVRGSTGPLSDLMDFEHPADTAPTIQDSTLPASACGPKPRATDLQGVPRQNAGAATCVWNVDLMQRQLVAAGAGKKDSNAATGADPGGFDICLYAERPTYYFQGYGRPVVLMSHTERPAGARDISDVFGEAAAMGNLKLASFTASASIADARFARGAVEQFVHQPVKTALGSTP